MLLLMGEYLRFCAVAAARPDSVIWRFLCSQQTHAEWAGCTLHDLIQPSFSFLVGVVLPFSLERRRARGDSFALMSRHAVIRSLVLIVLGVAMLSVHPRRIMYKFEDTLTMIGLGYFFLFLLAWCRPRAWWIALTGILAGYWLLFALAPLPAAGFDYQTVGVSPEWLAAHGQHGFAAHWQKNTNIAARFDYWFLNFFPQPGGAYTTPRGLATLSFIPTLATMLMGLCAGNLLRSLHPPARKIQRLVAWGVASIAGGVLLHVLGLCPIVKSIWTPSWVLFSGGICCIVLAASFLVVDHWSGRKFVLPLVVVGMNSIAAYVLTHLYQAIAFNGLRRVVGSQPFQLFGPTLEPFCYGIGVIVGLWLVLYGMYRARIFVRI